MHSALGEMLSRTGATAYEHDRLGRPTRRTHPDGVVAQWSWDPANGKGLLGVRSYGGKSISDTRDWRPTSDLTVISDIRPE